jgi:hypothetical protein
VGQAKQTFFSLDGGVFMMPALFLSIANILEEGKREIRWQVAWRHGRVSAWKKEAVTRSQEKCSERIIRFRYDSEGKV